MNKWVLLEQLHTYTLTITHLHLNTCNYTCTHVSCWYTCNCTCTLTNTHLRTCNYTLKHVSCWYTYTCTLTNTQIHTYALAITHLHMHHAGTAAFATRHVIAHMSRLLNANEWFMKKKSQPYLLTSQQDTNRKTLPTMRHPIAHMPTLLNAIGLLMSRGTAVPAQHLTRHKQNILPTMRHPIAHISTGGPYTAWT